VSGIGKKLESHNWEIFRERESARMVRRKENEDVLLEIDEKTTALDFPMRIRIEKSEVNQDFLKSRYVGVFDFDKLEFPLVLRNWREGDHFQPFGMNGRKKVSDFLISQKVELSQKRKVLVLESNGEIVWVVGMRISDKFKLTENTSAMWVMTVE